MENRSHREEKDDFWPDDERWWKILNIKEKKWKKTKKKTKVSGLRTKTGNCARKLKKPRSSPSVP